MDLAAAVADVLARYGWMKEIDVDTSDLSPAETFDLAKRIIDACIAQSIPVKGIRVDPWVSTVMKQREYENATVHQGAYIVLDPRLQDRLEVVRK